MRAGGVLGQPARASRVLEQLPQPAAMSGGQLTPPGDPPYLEHSPSPRWTTDTGSSTVAPYLLTGGIPPLHSANNSACSTEERDHASSPYVWASADYLVSWITNG